jgi:ubiquinone/menaquinone biosynthesis C-methylase UbiE
MTGGSMDANPRQAEPELSLRDVDAFFRDRSYYWQDVYREENNSLRASVYRERRSVVLALVDQLGLPGRSRVLEVGCGAGFTAVALAKRGYAVEAVDTVDAMLDLTRRAAVEAGVGSLVNTTPNSAIELDFPPQHFELVVVMGVLPWLEHPAKAMWETKRVLKPGGHVILTSANRWCLHQVVDPLYFPGLRPIRRKIQNPLVRLNLWTFSQPRPHRYSIKQIDDILSQTGLRKVQGMTLGFGPFTFFNHRLIPDRLGIKLHRRLQALADRQFPGVRSTGTEYVVMAVKPA